MAPPYEPDNAALNCNVVIHVSYSVCCSVRGCSARTAVSHAVLLSISPSIQ